MVDIQDHKNIIINFINETYNSFKTEFGDIKSLGLHFAPSKGILTLSFNVENNIDNENIESIEFEHKTYGTLLIEKWRIECQQEVSKWKYHKEVGAFEFSGKIKLFEVNRYLSRILREIIRGMTSKLNLPTTLLASAFPQFNSIIIYSDLENFGRTITRLFRNEIYKNYLVERDHYKNIQIDNFAKSINPLIETKLKDNMCQKALFYSSLTSVQIQFLDKIILQYLDETAFFVMSALDENNIEETGISLTVNNIDVRDLPLIGNGNLSGEYFDWIERFSEYGEFQY